MSFSYQALSQAPDNSESSLRVISLAPDLTENLAAIGASDLLVGRISEANYPQEILDIPIVGDYQSLNYETILALKPDLILAWQGGNPERLLQPLERMGMRVERINTLHLDQLPDQFLKLGELTGRSVAAKEVAQYFWSETDRYQYSSTHPVRVFYQLWGSPIMTINQSSWINDVIERCGGINPFADSTEAAPQIGMEALLGASIDLVIASDEQPENWRDSWTRWPDIPAVANKRLVTVDADLLHRLTLRTLEGMRQVCQFVAETDREPTGEQ